MKEYDIKYMTVSLRMTDETSVSDTQLLQKTNFGDLPSGLEFVTSHVSLELKRLKTSLSRLSLDCTPGNLSGNIRKAFRNYSLTFTEIFGNLPRSIRKPSFSEIFGNLYGKKPSLIFYNPTHSCFFFRKKSLLPVAIFKNCNTTDLS